MILSANLKLALTFVGSVKSGNFLRLKDKIMHDNDKKVIRAEKKKKKKCQPNPGFFFRSLKIGEFQMKS